MVGIRDIADAAGVSTATVNRVLRGTVVVSEGLTRRVQEAVAELDYVPNGPARILTERRTRLLGLLVPDLANPFSAQIARGVEDYATERGRHVIIGSSDLDEERERQYAEVFLSRIVDGVIVTPSGEVATHLARFSDHRIPLVFVDRHVPSINAPRVAVDNYTASLDAVARLLELGHRKIAMITGPLHFETASRRLDGYTAAYAAAGLEPPTGLIRSGFIRSAGGRDAVEEVLRLPDRPSALFCFNNLIAVGALQALADAGIRVPDDMSFITFDDMDLFSTNTPPVTAVAQPAYEMGSAAAELLMRQLDGEDMPGSTEVIFPTELRWRGSCGPPPDDPEQRELQGRTK